MLLAPDIRGCYPALITPMVQHGNEVEVDYDAFHRLIAHVIDHGVSGILIAGTTGQSATITIDEQIQLVQDGALFAHGYAAGKGREIQVIASAGSNSTHEALTLSREILSTGRVQALLHLTGYYNNPPQEGLLRHFATVADVAGEFDSGIILYNVPSRTGSNVLPRTVIQLAKHPAVLGIKEASGNVEQVQEILDNTERSEFAVLSGEDHMVAETIRRGGTGVISASANRWPHEFQTLCNLALAGEHEKAAELQTALQPCVDAVFSAKNPIPLHHMFGAALRLPLVSVLELDEAERESSLKAIEIAENLPQFPHVSTATAEVDEIMCV